MADVVIIFDDQDCVSAVIPVSDQANLAWYIRREMRYVSQFSHFFNLVVQRRTIGHFGELPLGIFTIYMYKDGEGEESLKENWLIDGYHCASLEELVERLIKILEVDSEN
jgi:hypothetical protein